MFVNTEQVVEVQRTIEERAEPTLSSHHDIQTCLQDSEI